MAFYKVGLPGLVIFDPLILSDSRGYFFEAYNEATFHNEGICDRFVQDNQSFSSYGVIRGLHYQQNPQAQAKLIRTISGNILDIAVDIRRGSPAYGQYFSIELSAENQKQLYLPAGFAHGFSVLSETAIVLYKCDRLYNKECEAGIRYDDPDLNIDWQVPMDKMIVSEKDKNLPSLKQCRNNFEFQVD